jgi:hypothetical protein
MVLFLSGGGPTSKDESQYSDVNFFVSGSSDSAGTTIRGSALFGGDLVASGSIIRSSTASSGSGWEDGYLGNPEFIPILPGDFNLPAYDNTSTRFPGPFGFTGVGRTAQFSSGSAATWNSNARWIYASKMIPKGFQADGVQVFCENDADAIAAYSNKIIDDTAVALIDTQPSPTNEPISFTLNPSSKAREGDGINYITVEIDLNPPIGPAAGPEEVYGGKIFLSRIR